MKIKLFLCIGFALFSTAFISGCSTNPATGRSQFTGLMSPQQESSVGAQEHPKILAEFGEYKNAKLQNYVQSIGSKVTQNTERADVQYKFHIVDSPIVNAFALPGGYIYVSRGLLALANNEAELASVLGHEAGHITGRHTAERYSRGVVTSLGVGVLAAAIDSAGASQALGIGSDLYLKSYSRSQEHEADSLGIRYMAQNGYDPQASATFLYSMQNASALENQLAGRQSDTPSYFSTHPATGERVNRASSEAGQLASGGALNRDAYLNMIDGMIYGDSPDQGFVRDQDFIHPSLGFKFSAPQGFRLVNQPQNVVAMSDSGALMVFDMVPNQGGQDAMSYLRQNWLKGESTQSPENIIINGMRAATAGFTGSVNNKPMNIQLVVVEFAPNTLARFQIGIPQGVSSAVVNDLKSATYSFAKLSTSERASYKPNVLRIITARAGDSVSSLSSKFPYSNNNSERFRVLNGLSGNQDIIVGQRYKIIAAQ